MNSEKKSVWGQLLKRARQAEGLSQQELAARSGLDVSYISRLERGSRRPRRQVLLRLATALHLNKAELEHWLLACDLAPVPILDQLQAAIAPSPPLAAKAGDRLLPLSEPHWWQRLGLEDLTLSRLWQSLTAAPPPLQEQAAATLSATLERLISTLQAPVPWAVIPAAGGQHRLLATPVMQQLLLQAIGEAAAIGICRFLVILAPGTVDTLWRPLQQALELAVAPRFELQYCLQPAPSGLGAAVLLAAPQIKGEPFLLLLPDEKPGSRAASSWLQELEQMATAYANQPAAALVAVAKTAKHYLPAGGVARLGPALKSQKIFQIAELVEKPPLDHPICQSPAARTIVGRYFLPSQVFGALQELQRQGLEPLELTAALDLLRHQGLPVLGYELKAPKRDLGGVIDRAEAIIYRN